MTWLGFRRTLLPKMLMLAGIPLLAAGVARASEHVTLKNGFDLVCDHRESVGDRVRLYTSEQSFFEVAAREIAAIEWAPAEWMAASREALSPGPLLHGEAISAPPPSKAELHEFMAKASRQHNLDVDLLASVVLAESGGNIRAVSRTGARGLMQLMPGTATELGVTDSFRPEQNINGGTAYLDTLLNKYHDNLALALAAYNAGPAAVDRYHGMPPYRETRAYVSRVIREFNRLCTERDATLRRQLRKLREPVETASNVPAMASPTAPATTGSATGGLQ